MSEKLPPIRSHETKVMIEEAEDSIKKHFLAKEEEAEALREAIAEAKLRHRLEDALAEIDDLKSRLEKAKRKVRLVRAFHESRIRKMERRFEDDRICMNAHEREAFDLKDELAAAKAECQAERRYKEEWMQEAGKLKANVKGLVATICALKGDE